MQRPDGLTPLRDRHFAWYYAARVATFLGAPMAPIALAFAVLDLNDSPTALGLVLAARYVPFVLFLLLGGVLADRLPRAAVLVWSCLLAGITQGAAATLLITGHATITNLALLEMANGALAAITFPASAAMTGQLAPPTHVQEANALLSFSRGALAVLGPTLSAILVAGPGAGWALAVDAAAWFVAAFCLRQVRVTGPEPEEGSILTQLTRGWSLFTSTRWLWVCVATYGVLNAIHAGAWMTLGPAVSNQGIGPRGWGAMMSAEAAGLLTVAVVMLGYRVKRPLVWPQLALGAYGVAFLLLAVQPHLVILLVAAFAAGAGLELSLASWNVALQENIAPSLLARAYSYDTLFSYVAMPVGQLTYGPLGSAFGIRPLLVASGIAYLLLTPVPLLSADVRHLGRRLRGGDGPGPPAPVG
jgi:MFS family permease